MASSQKFRLALAALRLFLRTTAATDLKLFFAFCIASVLLPHAELSLLPHVCVTVSLLNMLMQ